MKTVLKVLKYALGGLLILLAAALAVMAFHDPLPVRSVAQPGPESVSPWWEHPPALTPDEVAAQQWLADMTFRLPAERERDVWDVGGSQHGVFSIRYQAAFAGYAAAALGLRTPAYVGLTRAVLSNAVARVADRKAWSYIQTYWSQEPWFPDPCANGNVMYTGHLMMLMALEEALSGDTSFSRQGVSLAWDAERRFTYTTRQLADVTATQIRSGDGGVPCEPGLVFFACNNHPHDTFRLLEGMGYGDWRAESAKWEGWALGRFRATAGGGAFRVMHHAKSGLAYPRGMPGFDGWSLMWYAPWASDPQNPPKLWNLARKKIDWSEFGDDPHDVPVPLVSCDCCKPVRVPPAATAAFLAAAARSCSDGATAQRLEAWLDTHFLTREGGRFWLNTHREWRTGVSANRILALAQANGSDVRAMVRRPLPRSYFEGALLETVRPGDTPVYQAYREVDGTLVVELDGRGGAVTLTLRNAGAAPALRLPEGVRGAWDAASHTLALAPCGRVRLALAPASGP